MSDVTREMRNARKHSGMDSQGMLPAQRCTKCGKPMNADGNHPAELYAGTFTGLCYDCQSDPAYTVKTFETGAKLVSHPPHCPAWRRDREMFIAFDDCPECKGRGYKMNQRGFGSGGPYPEYCRLCSDRHLAALSGLNPESNLVTE